MLAHVIQAQGDSARCAKIFLLHIQPYSEGFKISSSHQPNASKICKQLIGSLIIQTINANQLDDW